MIKLTRLNSSEIIVNSDLIEFIELTPDTIISLTTGEKILVKEKADEIINKIVEYKKLVLSREIPLRVNSSQSPEGVDEERLVEMPRLKVVERD